MIDVYSELRKQSLNYESLSHVKTEFLVDDFIVSEAITMIYGKESQGKSWFLLSLVKKLEPMENIKNIVFVDLDNPKTQLKKRNLDVHFGNSNKILYLNKGDMTMDSEELLELFRQGARQPGQYYKGTVLIIDSTRDIVDNTYNDVQVKRFMQIMKDVRDAGGTVILIHHSTKNGKVIEGSSDFTKSADNVYELSQKARYDNVLHFALHVEYDRDPIKHCGFSVDTSTLVMGMIDPTLAHMNPHDEEIVKKIREELKKHPDGLNQGKLMTAIGYKSADRGGKAILERFTGKLWHTISGANRQKIFKIGL
ncbi:AAA family ATPase [Sulfurospirillum cavolei]|uniref:AAA family ATPase n=1 Tax=Sulfurospirillum cavolei TaxID=366522 RepID=UPI000764CE91|nr:AAA family ATPase [Sulfurospirillum cavolei]